MLDFVLLTAVLNINRMMERVAGKPWENVCRIRELASSCNRIAETIVAPQAMHRIYTRSQLLFTSPHFTSYSVLTVRCWPDCHPELLSFVLPLKPKNGPMQLS